MQKPRGSSSLALASCAVAVCFIALAFAMKRSAPADVPFDTGWTHEENSAYGRSYFSATTFVDCAHTRVGYRQSADIFSGGYTHDASGKQISYADMGILLENNDLAPGEIAAPNKVQLYGQGSTNGGTQLNRYTNAGHAPQRFFNVACDTPLRITFWVADERRIFVRYDGTFASKFGGKRFTGSLTASIDGFVPQDGWTTRCERCQVRRVTTMAVSSGGPTRPGAYFAMRDVDGSREPVGVWRDSVAGTYVSGPPGEAASYAIAPFTSIARDVNDQPLDAQRAPAGPPIFVIRHQGEPDETFGLDQR